MAKKTFNASQSDIDSVLNSAEAQDSGAKRKPIIAKVAFNHEALRKSLHKARRMLKLNLKYAAESCGLDPKRLADLERGYKSNLPQLTCKFNVHEVLSICLAFDLNIWDFTIMPVQMSVIDGSSAERRDRAWAECQAAWQQNAELRLLLKMALDGRISHLDRRRGLELCKLPPAGTVGAGN